MGDSINVLMQKDNMKDSTNAVVEENPAKQIAANPLPIKTEFSEDKSVKNN